MNGDGAARLFFVAADACLIFRAIGNQLTHLIPLGLGIDGEGFALGNVDALVCIEGGAVGKDQVDSSFDLNSVGNSYCSLDGIPYVVFKGEGFFIFVEYGSFYVLLGSVFVQIFRRAAYAKTVFIEVVLCRFTLEITVFTGNLVVLLIQINRGEGIMNYIARLNLHGPVVGVEHITVVFCPLGIGFLCKFFQRFTHGEFEVGIALGVGCSGVCPIAALDCDGAALDGDGAAAGAVSATSDCRNIGSLVFTRKYLGSDSCTIDDDVSDFSNLAAADGSAFAEAVDRGIHSTPIEVNINIASFCASIAATDGCTFASSVDRSSYKAIIDSNDGIRITSYIETITDGRTATVTAGDCSLNRSSIDGNAAGQAVIAAANGCAGAFRTNNGSSDLAAVDIDGSAVGTVVAAADGRAGDILPFCADLCRHFAAVEVQRAVVTIRIVAANGCINDADVTVF